MDILTILQVAGVFATGLGGIMSTFVKIRTKDEEHLTLRGRVAVWLTLGGLLLAAITTAISNKESSAATESLLSSATNTLSQLKSQSDESAIIISNLNEQALLANESLASVRNVLTNVTTNINLTLDVVNSSQTAISGIQRLASRFETINARAVFELPATDPLVTNLAASLDALTNKNFGNRFAKWPDGVQPTDAGVLILVPQNIKDSALKKKIRPFTDYFSSNQPAFLRLAFGSNDDLVAANESTNLAGYLSYSASVRHFHYSVLFEAGPVESWHSNLKILGFNDLGGAPLSLKFFTSTDTNNPFYTFNAGSKLAWCDLVFNKTLHITADSFYCTNSVGPNAMITFTYSTNLPDSTAILSGRAAKSKDF